MDARSESNLTGVHADLCKVVRGAAQEPQPFIVTYGVRTIAAEMQAMRTGHSQLTDPTDSRHVPQPGSDHMACAIDFTPLIGGEPSFAKGREAEVYGAVVAQIKASAEREGVPIRCGADWNTFKDWGHVELDAKRYPK